MVGPRRRSAASREAALRSCVQLVVASGPLWSRLRIRPDHLEEGVSHDVTNLVARALGLREAG